MSNWKTTLWDILITILTLGISHIQKRKKKSRKRKTASAETNPPDIDNNPVLRL